jgi:two-component system sensor histidine kinase UhpB
MADDFARRTRLPVHVAVDDASRWTPEAALVLFRVAQESLTNVARHSGATQAWLRLERDADRGRLIVEDDGRGLEEGFTPHLGLLGMRERLAGAGGVLVVGASPHGGLRVEATVSREEGV